MNFAAVLIKNLIAMMITEKMVVWCLKLAVKKTENKIDDNCVLLIEACYENDNIKLKEAIKGLSEQIK